MNKWAKNYLEDIDNQVHLVLMTADRMVKWYDENEDHYLYAQDCPNLIAACINAAALIVTSTTERLV
jgi:hypothetical protein